MDEKRILLVHPLGCVEEGNRRQVARLANVTPPVGLICIAAYLEKEGFRADILDCHKHPRADAGDRALQEILLRDKPAYLGVSCTTSIFNDGVRLSRLAKKTLPGIQVVFGGTHVSALKEKVLEGTPEIDFVVVGEGEVTLAELMKKGPDSASEIAGVACRGADGTARYSGHRDLSGLSLDDLPFPAYDKLDGFPRDYALPIFSYPRVPASTCVTSRGCPYRCSYCDRSVFRQSFRYNSADYMVEHVRQLHERYGIRHVLFYDDQFTFDRSRVESFCRQMIDSSLKVTFNCAVRAEHVDESLLTLMKKAGCWMMSVGIETGDEALLAGHRKDPDMAFLANQIDLIKRAGIRAKGLLMMGLPGEDEQSIRRSMAYVYGLPLDEMGIARFTPFPGSPIYEEVGELGTFDEDWDKMDCLHFQFLPKGMTRERLEELFKEFYKGYFMRPGTLWNYSTLAWKSPDSWRRFFLNLPRYWRFAQGAD